MNTIRAALAWVRRIRRLTTLMPVGDALRLTARENRIGDIPVHLRSLSAPTIVRGGTSDVHCFNKVLLDEEYRLPPLTAPELIVDAGANVGYATLYFAIRYPQARIVAIEPSPENFGVLSRNCGALPNVRLVNAALWPTRQSATLTDPLGEAWGYAVQETEAVSGTRVDTITIPDILAMSGSDRIGLLKLDIEGSERELFSKGAGAWIDRVDHIAIELHDRYRPGCAAAFYGALAGREFHQEIVGENVCISLAHGGAVVTHA